MMIASLHCECCDTCIQLAVAVESLRCYLLDPADDPRDPGVHSWEDVIRTPNTVAHHPDLCVPGQRGCLSLNVLQFTGWFFIVGFQAQHI